MTTINPSVLPISNTDINPKEPPDLIEVSPEILAKIEDIEEENNNNNKSLTILNKCWRWIRIYLKKLEKHNLLFLIGSFGVSAVLIFGVPRSPLAQPRNLIGDHLISAICGCTGRITIDGFEHSTACALAIVAMQLTETMHPPGGATTLIAVTTRSILPWAHFLFILMPVLTGACVMLLVALVINNMAPKRTYPCFYI